MFSAGSILAVLGYVIGAVGFLVYLLGTIKKGKNDILRQDNDDLTKSNNLLRSEKIANDAIIKEQAKTIGGLQGIATQTPAVERLIEMITSQQRTQTAQHTEVIKGLTSLTGKISDLAKAIDGSHKGKQ